MAHWRSLAGAAADLPLDFAGGVNTVGSARMVLVELPMEETEVLLRDIPPVYATEVHEVLLAALTRVLCAWTGRESVLIDCEGHGREDLMEGVDLTRTVGWFTTHYPELFEVPETAAPGGDLKAVKERLRAVPDRGIGFGALRYLSENEAIRAELRALPVPRVKLNYLGQLDQGATERTPFALSREDAGAAYDRRGERAHVLEFIAAVSGGALWMRWVYSENLHRATTIQVLSQEFLAALRAIFSHCLDPEAGGYTPSDFPDAHLDQEGLEMVLSQLLDEEPDAQGWEKSQ
jgi:non-ribosomal peptide synthase protein (TIGR01720 family)